MSTDYCEGCNPNNCGRGLCGRAALAAAPAAQAAPEFSDAAWALAQKVRTDLDRQSCPGVYMDIAMESIARNLAAAPVQAVPAMPDWHTPAERLVKWQHCMSYNMSYFGEPDGLLKQCVNELRHLLPPHELKAASPSAAPQPAERVPLTDEQLLALLGDIDADTKRLPPGIKAFARAVEQAHGIRAAGVKEPN